MFMIDLDECTYVDSDHRYIAMLAVGYNDEDLVDVDGAGGQKKKALAGALALTKDMGSEDTMWYVFDRKTGKVARFDQSDVAHMVVR